MFYNVSYLGPLEEVVKFSVFKETEHHKPKHRGEKYCSLLSSEFTLVSAQTDRQNEYGRGEIWIKYATGTFWQVRPQTRVYTCFASSNEAQNSIWSKNNPSEANSEDSSGKTYNSTVQQESWNLYATAANMNLTLFDLERDISPKPLLAEMSLFKKIVMSTKMSGKIEVIVPEHPADNK